MTGVVVGAAIVRRGAVLAARRTAPPALAGRWELPGGKVEAGETPQAAIVRELAEELSVSVAVTGWLAGATPINADWVLRVALCAPVGDSEPVPHEHDELRWLGPEDLDDVDWLDSDRPFLPELLELLLASQGRQADNGWPLRGRPPTVGA